MQRKSCSTSERSPADPLPYRHGLDFHSQPLISALLMAPNNNSKIMIVSLIWTSMLLLSQTQSSQANEKKIVVAKKLYKAINL